MITQNHRLALKASSEEFHKAWFFKCSRFASELWLFWCLCYFGNISVYPQVCILLSSPSHFLTSMDASIQWYPAVLIKRGMLWSMPCKCQERNWSCYCRESDQLLLSAPFENWFELRLQMLSCSVCSTCPFPLIYCLLQFWPSLEQRVDSLLLFMWHSKKVMLFECIFSNATREEE